MKNFVISVIVFAVLQCMAIWLISDVNFSSSTNEVDMEIFEFEYSGHEYLIFTEMGNTINVTHDQIARNVVKNKLF